jgi:hypothetical protein
MKRLQLVGRKFGRLTVLRDAGNDSRNRAQWLCRCRCGNRRVIAGGSLIRGLTNSCGCLHAELCRRQVRHMRTAWITNPIHGYARKKNVSAEYTAWVGMINRCTNPRSTSWKYYGGRGITICSRWRNDFKTFLADMGPRPPSTPGRKRSLYSIDRFPDKNGNYEPRNCRWATQEQQVQNSRLRESRVRLQSRNQARFSAQKEGK